MHEAEIETTPEGQVPVGAGWFVLNLAEMAWETVPGFGVARDFEAPNADPAAPRIGVHVHVLQPGESNGYYHAEDAQEGFLVLSGECVAVIENEERRMRQWDYFHSPPGTEHITVGAGDEPCVILMTGSRTGDWRIRYVVSELAARYGASADEELSDPRQAYVGFEPSRRERPSYWDRLPWA